MLSLEINVIYTKELKGSFALVFSRGLYAVEQQQQSQPALT